MGQTFLLTMTLHKQGVVRGSSTRKEGDLDFSKGMECHGFNYEVTSQHNVGSGDATGLRQHQPITIVREVDKASPLLWSALQTNELVKAATIQFPKISSNGKPVLYQKIELTNALISKITSTHSGGGGSGPGKKRFEEVSLTFEGITINGIPNAHAILAHLSIIK